jgi:hypothetical protein
MAAIKERLALQTERILDGKAMWTEEEIRASLGALIPGTLRRSLILPGNAWFQASS